MAELKPMERARSLHALSLIAPDAITYVADEIHFAVLAERERLDRAIEAELDAAMEDDDG